MLNSNLATVKKTRSMCLLYGIACLMAGLFSFLLWDEQALGSLLMLIAILGFWRISHQMKAVLNSEEPGYFNDPKRNKDSHGR